MIIILHDKKGNEKYFFDLDKGRMLESGEEYTVLVKDHKWWEFWKKTKKITKKVP